MSEGPGPLIFLVAGEPSGDALGARLMAALKRSTGGAVRFAGVGGERMAAEGLASLFPIQDIAVMGITEILPRIPRLLRRINQTVAAARAGRPDAIVTIDAPAFCHRVAGRLAGLGTPRIHYVAPQLWAWRPGRARKFARRFDHMMVLLPFEPEFFARLGLACTYVGHPVIEQPRDAAVGGAFRARHGLSPELPLVAMLPGSRAGLAGRMLPVFAAAAADLHRRHPNLTILVPTVPGTAAAVRQAAPTWPFPWIEVGRAEDKPGAFAAAAAALTVSGTATMELAVAGTPMAVGYRVSRLTAWLARRMIRVAHVAMPNLILGRGCVPELLQDDCTPQRLADTVDRLLTDRHAASAQRNGLAEVCRLLGQDRVELPGGRPSDRAAATVLDIIGRRRRRPD